MVLLVGVTWLGWKGLVRLHARDVDVARNARRGVLHFLPASVRIGHGHRTADLLPGVYAAGQGLEPGPRALISNGEIVEMKEKDVKDGTEKFPYTASILAGALKYLTEKEEERSENKHPEEVKQEETYSEAVKAGHMQANFIGEMRSNNSLPMSHPLA